MPDTVEPGPDAVRHVQARLGSFARRWRDSDPAAVKFLLADRDSRGWRGFTMTATGLRLLHDLRRSLLDPPTPLRHVDQQTVTPADSVGAVA